MGREQRNYTRDEFRFSGSYVSRYMNCHGSAVLAEAIPTFVAKVENQTMTTPSGKIKQHVIGTAIHNSFQEMLDGDVLEKAALLDELAAVRGPKRTALLEDETKYITWWFLGHNTLPPIEFNIISRLHIRVEEQQFYDEDSDAYEVIPAVAEGATPKQLRFLADALRYCFDIIDNMDGARVFLEETRPAVWTATQPRTTADIVITDGKQLEVIDLKLGTLAVEAFENYQLLYYTQTYKTTETRHRVHILQPGNFDSWEVTPETLEAWKQKALEAEQAILNGSLLLRPGKHCLFCPANPYSKGEKGSPVCPAQMEALFGPQDLSIITEEE